MKRISLILFLSLLLSFGMSVIASAEEYAVDPRYNNAISVDSTLEIQDGTAVADIVIVGKEGVTSRISANVKLEKRALWGLIWNDIEEWNASSVNCRDSFTFTKEVGNGTYRCTFETSVEGSGGSTDVITKEKTAEN